MMRAETLARFMHDIYEKKAKETGWHTQKNCQVEFDKLPERNKATMIEVAKAVIGELEDKKIRKEIYWIFRDAIHNGHTQIMMRDGKLSSYKPIKETGCYVCDILYQVEKKVADEFGEKYYTDTL